MPELAETAFLTSERIFQSSDLKKDRALLDVARDGFARLRDIDGTGLVMLREAQLKKLAEGSRAEHIFADVSRELLRVERLVRGLGTAEHLDPVTVGHWTWLSEFDLDDLQEFVDEVATAVIRRDLRAVLDALMGWEETASALADPDRRAALTSEHSAEDYVDVVRPEEQDEDDAASPAAQEPVASA